MKRIATILVVAAMVSICLAGAVPDKTWQPETISLTYSVSVPKDVPLKITKTWGKDTQTIFCVDDFLFYHRASFRACVRNYIQGKSLELDPNGPVIDYPIDQRAIEGGHQLAREQIEKLEKQLGKEKLIQQLKDEGYADEARK
jgi:hypothetical protein